MHGRIASVNVLNRKAGPKILCLCFDFVAMTTGETALGTKGLGERLADVRRRVSVAAERAGRSLSEITLIAISKTHPPEVMSEALKLGVKDLGENRVQEAEQKVEQVGRKAARWHLVGHLQGNKARRAVSIFDCIHSVDSPALAQRLDRHCVEEQVESLDVLIQIDLAGEATKTGIDPREVSALLDVIKQCQRLQLKGLMILPPYFEDPECVRPFFKTLRQLRDELQGKGRFGDSRGELSMGMTHDFEIAIEEGATMIRVGTAIFGQRNLTKPS